MKVKAASRNILRHLVFPPIAHRASVFGNSHWEILLNEGVTAFFAKWGIIQWRLNSSSDSASAK